MDTWEETTGQPRRREEAEQFETPSKTSEKNSLRAEISGLEAKLCPPSTDMVMAELGRCLRLTVPSGMTQEERKEWLRVAFAEVKDMPSCEFADACSAARKIADHPAKIIPAIHAYKPESFASARWYRQCLGNARTKLQNIDAPRLERKPGDFGPIDTAKIREEMGFPSEPTEPVSRNSGTLREPTKEELAEIAAQFAREHGYSNEGNAG